MFFLRLLMEYALIAALAWGCMFLLVFVHELGHALMYAIFYPGEKWHITVGLGRNIIQTSRLTVNAIIIKGHITFNTKTKVRKLANIVMLIGGPLATLLWTVLAWFIFHKYSQLDMFADLPVLKWLIAFAYKGGFYMFLFSVIPLKFISGPFKGYVSDGYRIMQILNSNRKRE